MSERRYPVSGGPFHGSRCPREISDYIRYGNSTPGREPVGEYEFAIDMWIWRERKEAQVKEAQMQAQAGLGNVGLGAIYQYQPPSVEELQKTAEARQMEEYRRIALQFAFEHIKGDWQEALRAARDILAFLQTG